MESLVANYSDSENEETEDSLHKNSLDLPFVDFFVDTTQLGSSSSEEEIQETSNFKNKNKTSIKKITEKLPNPLVDKNYNCESKSFDTRDKFKNPGLSSVFITSFQRVEDAKKSVLEQHVKLTQIANDENEKKNKKCQFKKNNKNAFSNKIDFSNKEFVKNKNFNNSGSFLNKTPNICFSFLKGNCKFGDNCRFSHDQNINKNQDLDINPFSFEYELSTEFTNPNKILDDTEDNSLVDLMLKRKNRAGVSDTLIPPKKAMNSLLKQREEERPWTLSKNN